MDWLTVKHWIAKLWNNSFGLVSQQTKYIFVQWHSYHDDPYVDKVEGLLWYLYG